MPVALLPQESMDAKQLFRLILHQITWTDIVWILLATLLITVIGIMTPTVTRILFSRIIPTGEKLLAVSMTIVLLSTAVAAYMINIVRNELMDRIGDRMEIFSIHALMSRVLNLPVDFFTGKTAGALASSIMQVKDLAGICHISGAGSHHRDLRLSAYEDLCPGTGGPDEDPGYGLRVTQRDPEDPSQRQ